MSSLPALIQAFLPSNQVLPEFMLSCFFLVTKLEVSQLVACCPALDKHCDIFM